MRSFFDEFKQFILRGNAIELAVGIVIGVAFNGIVNSLVADIFMPIIGVEKEGGTYVQRGKVRTMAAALSEMVELVKERHPQGSLLRLQILHGNNAAGVELLKQKLERLYKCNWLPSGMIAPALGAHTGPGLVGLIFASESVFPIIA